MSESPFRDPLTVDWDFRAEGYSWGKGTWERLKLIEDFKLEVWEGKLMFDDTMRLLLLGLLIENVGLDKVVKLGDPTAWQEAVAALES